MAILNLIINLAALMLWLNWLQVRVDALTARSTVTLGGTLKPAAAAAPRRWGFGVALVALLVSRAWLYVQLGGVLSISPKLRLGPVIVPFRADIPLHMLVFSALSFGSITVAFYLWLFFVSAVNGRDANENSAQKMVQSLIKWAEPLPASVKLLSPFLVGCAAWVGLHPLLRWVAAVPETPPLAHFSMQAVAVGLGTFLVWKYLIIGVVMFYVVDSYLYIGDFPAWKYLNQTARNLLSPLRPLPLRAGRVDLLPWLVMAAVVLGARLVEHPPEKLSQLLPF